MYYIIKHLEEHLEKTFVTKSHVMIKITFTMFMYYFVL